MYKRKRAGNTITRKINSTKDTAAKADKNHYISNSYLEGFIPIDTEYFTASLCKHRVQHLCRSPCSLPAVRQFMHFPFRKMKCPEYFISRSHLLPLSPVHRSDSVAKPFIRSFHQAFHIRKPVIVYPPICIFPELLFSLRVAPLVSPHCQFPETVLHLPD